MAALSDTTNAPAAVATMVAACEAPSQAPGGNWSALPQCPLSVREALAVAPVSDTLVVFGGLEKVGDALEVTNDLAAFSTSAESWGKQECTGPAPLARTGHTFTAVAPCHKLVVQGGLNHDNGYLEDVHMLCTDTLQWSGAVETTNKGPCARDKHSAVAFGDTIYYFGGFGMVPAPKTEEEEEGVQGAGALFFGWHNDLFTLNVATMTWQTPEITGTPPSTRAAHAASALGSNMVIFGGRDSKGRTNDLHVLETEGMRWTQIATLNQPCKRSFHSAAIVPRGEGHRLVVFGGVDVNSRHHASVHQLDITKALESSEVEWVEVEVSGEKPSPRGNCGSCLIGNSLYLIAGSSAWDQDSNMCSTFHGDSFKLTF